MKALGPEPSAFLSVRVPPDVLADLRERAWREQRTPSAVVRDAIRAYLTSEVPWEQQPHYWTPAPDGSANG